MKVSFTVKLFWKSWHHNFRNKVNHDCTAFDGALANIVLFVLWMLLHVESKNIIKETGMPFVVLWCPRPSLDSGRNIFHRVLAPSFLHLNMLCIFVSIIIVSVSFCTPLRFCGVLSVPSSWPSSPSRCPSPWPSPSSSPLWRCRWRYLGAVFAGLPFYFASRMIFLLHHHGCWCDVVFSVAFCVHSSKNQVRLLLSLISTVFCAIKS